MAIPGERLGNPAFKKSTSGKWKAGVKIGEIGFSSLREWQDDYVSSTVEGRGLDAALSAVY
jgi:hypothetical protein